MLAAGTTLEPCRFVTPIVPSPRAPTLVVRLDWNPALSKP